VSIIRPRGGGGVGLADWKGMEFLGPERETPPYPIRDPARKATKV
jgi:hypothetical protein